MHPALQGYPVAWFAPTNKFLNASWERAVEIFAPVTTRKLEQQHSIDLVTGGKVEMWSLEDRDAGRSRKYKRVIIDEAAHVPHLEYSWGKVIRHTLIDYAGDAWLLSTPNGLNYFNTLFGRAGNTQYPGWNSWQMPSHSNPYLSPAELQEVRNECLPSEVDQEIFAQFLNAHNAAFIGVRECANAEFQTEPDVTHQYAFGVDWGRRTDATVVAIIDLNLRACCAIERWEGMPYPEQQARMERLNNHWGPLAIIAESNSMGQPVIENLQMRGLPIQPFMTTNASKDLIVRTVALAMENQTISYVPDPVLVEELQSFAAEKLPGGMVRYAAPPGKHDDTVMALAIGWQAVESYAPQSHTVVYEDRVHISSY